VDNSGVCMVLLEKNLGFQIQTAHQYFPGLLFSRPIIYSGNDINTTDFLIKVLYISTQYFLYSHFYKVINTSALLFKL
jgi:hypothetical protein